MLSGVLRSKEAVDVNVSIIRAFVKMRQMLTETNDLKLAIDFLREEYDAKFERIFADLDELNVGGTQKTNPIGFVWDKRGS